MPITDFYINPVTILTPAPDEDIYGDDIDDWANAQEAETTGWLHEINGTEALGNRDTVIGAARLFLPADTTITALDRVVVAGRTYEVDGAPRTSRTREGAHHLEVELRCVEQGEPEIS